MAAYESTKAVNLIAGEDLRDALYSLLYVEDDSDVGKVIKTTATTQTPVGILGENPRSDVSTDGFGVPVVLLNGIVKLLAGAAITAGNLIVADVTAGRVAGVADLAAIPADSMAIGVALESAIDGDVFEVLAQSIAAPHTA